MRSSIKQLRAESQTLPARDRRHAQCQPNDREKRRDARLEGTSAAQSFREYNRRSRCHARPPPPFVLNSLITTLLIPPHLFNEFCASYKRPSMKKDCTLGLDVEVVYTLDEEKSLKTIMDNDMVWIPFLVNHNVNLSEEQVIGFYNHTIPFSVWTSMIKQGNRLFHSATVNAIEAFLNHMCTVWRGTVISHDDVVSYCPHTSITSPFELEAWQTGEKRFQAPWLDSSYG
uniref:Uncharacterized protein n=1 Tax=Timema cristinae TaxID=61476 RepID=A0A7R9H7E5_TIMCR|nr:unnamed protein product [Timema cristinae]